MLRKMLGIVVVLGLGSVALVAASAPAGAQISENCNPNGPECISIESAQVLHYRTLLTVDGTGFAPGTQVVLEQGGDIPGGTVLFNHRRDMTVTVGADGTFHVVDAVNRVFNAHCTNTCADGKRGLQRRVNCAIDTCFLQVVGASDVFGTDLSGIWG
jgi:hypothetical protein